MTREKGWVELVFGTGILFNAAAMVVALVALYHSSVRTRILEAREQQATDTSEKAQTLLTKANERVSGILDRLKHLEQQQQILEARATKAEATTVVAQLEQEYSNPQATTLLGSWNSKYSQHQGAKIDAFAKMSPLNPTPLPTLPTLPKLGHDYDFLKSKDRKALEELTLRAKPEKPLSLAIPVEPRLDSQLLSQAEIPKEQSFLEKLRGALVDYWVVVLALGLWFFASVLSKH